jgi:hypothetical protein
MGGNMQEHIRRAALLQQVDDSANESFATAPEEPYHAKMAFHIKIDLMMVAAAHNANGDPQSVSKV